MYSGMNSAMKGAVERKTIADRVMCEDVQNMPMKERVRYVYNERTTGAWN